MPSINYTEKRKEVIPRTTPLYVLQSTPALKGNISNFGYIPYALLSGSFAALASVFAKLFTDARTLAFAHEICVFIENTTSAVTCKNGNSQMDQILLATRAICFSLIFACNALMWSLFTKGLSKSVSSVQVTVMNSATNFCATAILGNLIFEEPLALQWWFGASFIVLGTLLMARGQPGLREKLD